MARETRGTCQRQFGDFTICNLTFLYKKRCVVIRIRLVERRVCATVKTECLEVLSSSSPVISLIIVNLYAAP